jgi:hypothetical protein
MFLVLVLSEITWISSNKSFAVLLLLLDLVIAGCDFRMEAPVIVLGEDIIEETLGNDD